MGEREGPKVTVERTCDGCRYEHTERYKVQGDSGCNVSCVHPSIGKKSIGDTTWRTPAWCPFLAARHGHPFPPEVVERAYDAANAACGNSQCDACNSTLSVIADYLRSEESRERVARVTYVAVRDAWDEDQSHSPNPHWAADTFDQCEHEGLRGDALKDADAVIAALLGEEEEG